MFTPLENNTDTIISRGISTVPLTLNFPAISTTTTTGTMATTEITTTNTEEVNTATIEMSTTTTSAEDPEDNILEHIRKTTTFNRIHAMVSVVGG